MDKSNNDEQASIEKRESFTKVQYEKFERNLLSQEPVHFQALMENLENLSSSKEKISEFFVKVFSDEFDSKTRKMIYVIIIYLNSNYKFGFDEESYLLKVYNNFISDYAASSNSIELFDVCFAFICYFILLFKYNYSLKKNDMKTFIDAVSHGGKDAATISLFEYINVTYDSYAEFTKSLNENGLLSNLSFYYTNSNLKKYSTKSNINTQSTIANFDITKFYNFTLFITTKNHIPIQIKTDTPALENFLFFQKHQLIKEKIESLYTEENSLTKILFYGPKCSGKTSFAKQMLTDPLIIEIDEQIETNYLLGGYLINEFSEIIWQDGILISALKSGRDILLLSMEKCSNDLLSIMKQLLEKNKIFILAKQETVSNFKSKLLMIYNSDSKDFVYNFLSANSFSFAFTKYTFQDMIQICKFKENLSEIETDFLQNLLEIYMQIPNETKVTSRYRVMTLSNMIHFSKILKEFFTENSITNFINEKSKMQIVSIFFYNNLFSIDNEDILTEITKIYANKMNLPFEVLYDEIFNIEKKYLFPNSEFNQIKIFTDDNVKTFTEVSSGSTGEEKFYSYNTNSKFFIKIISNFVNAKRNILLVGETGVGKTRTIQNLASMAGVKLNVINLSQSSDESDLFGGFKPVSTQTFLKKYLDQIVEIFTQNFDADKNVNFLKSLYSAFKEKNEKFFIKYSIGALAKINSSVSERKLKEKISNLTKQLQKLQHNFEKKSTNSFQYINGILLNAIKNDEWILLDEINLASDEVLLKLKSILEGNSIYIMNDNQINEFKKGKKFRIFGSMNPEYNIGKKKLPNDVREFFSEVFFKETSNKNDIVSFVSSYLNDLPQITAANIEAIAEFYLEVKSLQKQNEIQKPNSSSTNFSLRTLTRALISIRNGSKIFNNINHSIYEALQMNFLSQMDSASQLKITNESLLSYKTKLQFHSLTETQFVLTPMFESHLKTLNQIVTLSDYAVLLEGPTSCGKTSIVEYLARCKNKKILRINNNNNTEVEEYLGSYTTDSNGNFYFNEGFLVKAVKEGMWIILDEINLAPSEVLEALNRLLDDNRELYLPENNLCIKAHQEFRIFAAMNPSEYAGRKDLSDAFKNRFIHLFFDNIPNEELNTIIQKRCSVPKSRTDIMIEVYSKLHRIRCAEKVFLKGEGFITIRDLIKWGTRTIDSYEELAIEGYVLLAEKLRNKDEKEIVRKVIEEFIKKGTKKEILAQGFIEKYYNDYVENKFKNQEKISNGILFTHSMKRILTLVDKAISSHEPVLLIGDTGTGKTISCEFLSRYYKKKLITVNCHENMDTNDFLGSLRSVTSTSRNTNSLFEWVDGPVTTAMKNGEMLLIDEIGLVNDSVLERMNSIFEADSVLVLSEKNIDNNVEVIKPHPNFNVVGAMNPSEYSNKDLSAALRARFTEIYIDAVSEDDIKMIIMHKVSEINVSEEEKKSLYEKLFEIYLYYNSISEISKPMTFRDVDIICEFISINLVKFNNDLSVAFSHAIQMTIIEGLYLNETLTPEMLLNIKSALMTKFALNSINELTLLDDKEKFGITPFVLSKNTSAQEQNSEFVFTTATLKQNLLKILRGMSITKPILIEGSPGVGKTTLIQNIAKKLNKKIHRVNLSEHTDMIDLIGSQYPSSSSKSKFKWIDGVLLTAMKNGDWIIIDEMNLASQSILEGINSILDHRRSIFVTELNKEIKCKESFQLFATQNPVNQGGGRKFLPRAFLNRFIKIYLDDLNDEDYEEILTKMTSNKPGINSELIHSLVKFNRDVISIVHREKLNINEIGEFNLRTMIKFIACLVRGYDIKVICNTIYIGRIRSMELKKEIYADFQKCFNITSAVPNLNNYDNEIKLCIECNFPIIVTGKPNSGKKFLIQRFKQSRKINQFFLYSTMDSSELLGNFDKANVNYHIKTKINGMKGSKKSIDEIVNELTSINLLKSTTVDESEYVFEWHDSILVQSILCGDWIILDGVNTCSSAVLDRLNSLLDDDKMINLSESGDFRSVTMNPDFRLFMTMNTNQGEVSRALKNRCVELYYDGINISKTTSDQENTKFFLVNGDFENIEIALGKFTIRTITKLIFDMISICNLKSNFSFDAIIIFLCFCVDEGWVDFRKFEKYIGIVRYYMSRENDEVKAISKGVVVVEENEVCVGEIECYIKMINDYFALFSVTSGETPFTPLQIKLFLFYVLNVSNTPKGNFIIQFFEGITSTLLSGNPSNQIKKVISYPIDIKNGDYILFEMYNSLKAQNEEIHLSKNITDYFSYDYNVLTLQNIYRCVSSHLNLDSKMNEMRKLISMEYENEILKIFNAISKEPFIDYLVKAKFLTTLLNTESNTLLIRYNSELFISVLTRLLLSQKKQQKEAKNKFPKINYSPPSQTQIASLEHSFANAKSYSISQEILVAVINYSLRLIEFSTKTMNNSYLNSILNELYDKRSEMSLMPIISSKKDIENIQKLVHEHYNTNFISEDDINIIFDLFDEKCSYKFIHKEKFLMKFLTKSQFIFFMHVSSNYSNEFYYTIIVDLIRVIIIDAIKSDFKTKINSNDETTYNLIQCVKNAKKILSIYPYLYFFTKISYEGIESAMRIISLIESFDLTKVCQQVMKKFTSSFQIEGNPFDAIIPDKNKIYKIIGRGLYRDYYTTMKNVYTGLEFGHQFVNEEENPCYVSMISKAEEKIKKYSHESLPASALNMINSFINDIEGINEDIVKKRKINKKRIMKLIDYHLINFCDLIMPLCLVLLCENINTEDRNTCNENAFDVEFNPTSDEKKIRKALSALPDDESKLQYLIANVNPFNKQVMISAYNFFFYTKDIETFDNPIPKVKKYTSIQEKVLNETKVIGDNKKVEESEQQEITERFPTYEDTYDIYSKQNIDEAPSRGVVDKDKISLLHFIFLCKAYEIPIPSQISSVKPVTPEYYTKLTAYPRNSTKSALHSMYSFYKSNIINEKMLINEDTDSLAISNSMYNFYLDPNPKEIKLIYLPINAVITKCREYLLQFENHPVLVTILFICNTILNFNSEVTPLNKMLSILDSLLTKMHEWETYSSKRLNSLNAEIENIMRIIRHYRKIELLSWKNFFLSHETKSISSELTSYLTNIITTGITEDFINNSSDFVSSSNIASFRFRLSIIKILSEMCQKENEKNLLNNTYVYYNINYLKSGKFEKFSNAKMEEIEMKMKSLIKISKWDIRNYFNFRDNIKRNYKQLNKIIKDNENTFLINTIRDVIEEGVNEYKSKTFVFDTLPKAGFSEDELILIFDLYRMQVFDRIKTLKELKVENDTNLKNKALLDLISTNQEIGYHQTYKLMQNEIYNHFKNIKLEENSISAYVCKILEKVNMMNSVNEKTFCPVLHLRYLDRFKGLSFSMFERNIMMLIAIKNLKEKLDMMFIEKYFRASHLKSIDQDLIDFVELLKDFFGSIDINEINDLYHDLNSTKDFNKNYASIIAKIRNLENYVALCSTWGKGDKAYIINVIKTIFEMASAFMEKIKDDYFVSEYLYAESFFKAKAAYEKLQSENVDAFSDKFVYKEYLQLIQSYIKDNEDDSMNAPNPFNEYYFDPSESKKEEDKESEQKGKDNTKKGKEDDKISINVIIEKIQTYTENLSLSNNNLFYVDSVIVPQLNEILLSLLKLSNISISIFYNISVNGFCKKEQTETKQEEGTGVREGGYGMADAKGMEDITKEIEDEEQLLGLQDDGEKGNEDNNENQNEGGDKKNPDEGFEMKTDFKEDYKEEIKDNEEEGKEIDGEDVEREEDSVNEEDGNKMYDEENSLGEEEDEKGEKKREVDLTDKNVQAEKGENELKAKEDDRKDNIKDVDKNDENKDEGNHSDDSSVKENEEKKKVEKLDVDKGEKEQNEEEENNTENEDENASVRTEENLNQNQGEKEDKMDVEEEDLEINENEENNSNEGGEPEEGNEDDQGENSDSSDKGGNNISIDKSESADENDEENTKMKSNPIASKENDLGYNPLTKNKGNTGSKTAKNTKDELNNAEQEEKEENPFDPEQLKDLDQFKEVFDINSLLDSVWTSRQNMKQKIPNKDIIKNENNNVQAEEEEKVEENFKFENYEDQQQEQQFNSSGGFNQGYSSKDNQGQLAKGNADKQNNNQQQNTDKENIERRDVDTKMANEENITLYENDKNAEIVDNGENEEDGDEQMEEEEENQEKIDANTKMEIDEEAKKDGGDAFSQPPQKSKTQYIINTSLQNQENILQPTEEEIEEELTSAQNLFNSTLADEEKKDPLNLLSKFESLSQTQILKLTELLKQALSPNKQTKLKGNYKTGKRLNMKKIINFIASNYRQDKIWLRRTLPHERDYFITIAIDDSLSMKEHNLGFFALQSLVILTSALTKLNIAKISVCSIQNDMGILNSFSDNLNKEKLANILSSFRFDFSSNNSYDYAMRNFLIGSMKMIENATYNKGSNINQIVFIISDGRFNKDNCRNLCSIAREKGLLYVFVILDQYDMDDTKSVLKMLTVSPVDYSVRPYLEDFPFQYYVVVQDPRDLPDVIQGILVKWFEGIN